MNLGLNCTYEVSSLLAVDSLLEVVKLFREITAVYSEYNMEQINTVVKNGKNYW
jgi:hypothetical protein